MTSVGKWRRASLVWLVGGFVVASALIPTPSAAVTGVSMGAPRGDLTPRGVPVTIRASVSVANLNGCPDGGTCSTAVSTIWWTPLHPDDTLKIQTGALVPVVLNSFENVGRCHTTAGWFQNWLEQGVQGGTGHPAVWTDRRYNSGYVDCSIWLTTAA